MSIKNQTHTASSNIWMTVAEAATYRLLWQPKLSA